MPDEGLTAMTDEQLAQELALEVKRDRWVADWPASHPGRKIRDEQERRRVARLALVEFLGPDAYSALFRGQWPAIG